MAYYTPGPKTNLLVAKFNMFIRLSQGHIAPSIRARMYVTEQFLPEEAQLSAIYAVSCLIALTNRRSRILKTALASWRMMKTKHTRCTICMNTSCRRRVRFCFSRRVRNAPRKSSESLFARRRTGPCSGSSLNLHPSLAVV